MSTVLQVERGALEAICALVLTVAGPPLYLTTEEDHKLDHFLFGSAVIGSNHLGW